MMPINWLKLIPYIAVLVLIAGLGAYGKYEHACKLSAEKSLSDYVAQVAEAHVAAKAEADARLSIASEVIGSQAKKVKAQEDALAKLGITREQTKKDLDNALKSNNEILVSRNNVLDGLNRLQSTTSKDSVREGSTSAVLPISQDECIRASETVRVIRQASIFTVNDYDSCITQLEAIYKQHNQPIHFTDDAP